LDANQVLVGDCLARMPEIPAGWAHVCCTSPPYFALRSYLPKDHPDKAKELGSEPTPEAFVSTLVEVFRGVRRVLRDDGVLWLNLGDSYNSHPGQRKTTDKVGPKQATNSGSNTIGSRNVSGSDAGCQLLMPHRVALALIADGWCLRSTVIWQKCLSGGTWLYARTQKGVMPAMLKDLVRLNPATVQLWDGQKWNQVVQWSERPTPPKKERSGQFLELRFRSGERVGCTAEHRWPTQRGLLRADELRVCDIVSISKLPDEDHSPGGLPDDDIGWLIGFYIAEGNLTDKSVIFSTHENEHEFHERIAKIAGDFDASIRVRRLRGRGAIVAVHGRAFRGMIEHYVSGSTSKDKRLRTAAWQRSDRFLEAMIQGYLDGDGHEKNNGGFSVGFTSNDRWAVDLRTLCARLGWRCTLKRHKHTCLGKDYPGWRGYIRGPANGHHNEKSPGEIVEISASKARTFWDVSLAEAPNTFCLASGILTHNSSPMPESVSGWRWRRCRIKTKPQVKGTQGGATNMGRSRDMSNGQWLGSAEYIDCPGCHKCLPNDGYVLRRGKWRPTNSFEYLFMFSKGKDYFCDGDAVAEVAETGAKGSRFDKGKTGQRVERAAQDGYRDSPTRNPRAVWTFPNEPFKGKHFATYPSSLPKRCIEASTSSAGCCATCGSQYAPVVESVRKPTRPGTDSKVHGACDPDSPYLDHAAIGNRDPERHVTSNVIKGYKATCLCEPSWVRVAGLTAAHTVPCRVFDPFLGSGQTARAAHWLGRDWLGCELNPVYAAMVPERIAKRPKWAKIDIVSQTPLFQEAA
jgi:DNA modification methylase